MSPEAQKMIDGITSAILNKSLTDTSLRTMTYQQLASAYKFIASCPIEYLEQLLATEEAATEHLRKEGLENDPLELVETVLGHREHMLDLVRRIIADKRAGALSLPESIYGNESN